MVVVAAVRLIRGGAAGMAAAALREGWAVGSRCPSTNASGRNSGSSGGVVAAVIDSGSLNLTSVSFHLWLSFSPAAPSTRARVYVCVFAPHACVLSCTASVFALCVPRIEWPPQCHHHHRACDDDGHRRQSPPSRISCSCWWIFGPILPASSSISTITDGSSAPSPMFARNDQRLEDAQEQPPGATQRGGDNAAAACVPRFWMPQRLPLGETPTESCADITASSSWLASAMVREPTLLRVMQSGRASSALGSAPAAGGGTRAVESKGSSETSSSAPPRRPSSRAHASGSAADGSVLGHAAEEATWEGEDGALGSAEVAVDQPADQPAGRPAGQAAGQPAGQLASMYVDEEDDELDEEDRIAHDELRARALRRRLQAVHDWNLRM